MNQSVLQWFADKGITPHTVESFLVQVNDDGAVAFPYQGVGDKLRYGIPTGERSFRWPKGTTPVLFNRKEAHKETVFLVEGETDCMRLWQELQNDPSVGVVALPGIETWNDDMALDLSQAGKVYVILDNDQDYRVAGRVDQAYRDIRASVGPKARRIYLPRAFNDICEFFEDHSLDGFVALVKHAPQAGESRYKTLDLLAEPPPIEWLVDGMVCRGDIHLFIGEPGIGKSWLTMGLARSIADNTGSFIGRDVHQHGRVLYLDEENPPDLVYDRFRKLGLSKEGAKNIRFINNESIRLDRDPTQLIDEALDYDPILIVLDSLTRFHTEDENSAGAMSSLFNDALKPLARKTRAAVALIHHANKGDALSGYKRSRGSGDITASVDAGFDVRQIENHVMQITNFKSRRVAQGDGIFVSLLDQPGGGVELLGMAGYGGLF